MGKAGKEVVQRQEVSTETHMEGSCSFANGLTLGLEARKFLSKETNMRAWKKMANW